MKDIREYIRNLIENNVMVNENVQLADKIYFNSGKLSPEVKKYILHITRGDAWTKLVTDMYWSELQQSIKAGKFALSALDRDIENDDENDDVEEEIENDMLNLEYWKKIKALYLQLKNYNKNVFPIKGFNINGVDNTPYLMSALKQRNSILEYLKKLPSVAIRNMKEDIRQERDYPELQEYRSRLEYFLAQYSQLSNRDSRLRKNIESKMFKANITLNDLIEFAEEKENLLGGKNFTKNSVKKLVRDNSYDMEIVYESASVMVVDVTSPEGIKKIGCNSLWCFTYGSGFEGAYRNWSQYSTNDHVYVIIDFREQADSPDFMHVLIKPLDYTQQDNDSDGDVNDSKLFDMSNQESYDPIGVINNLVGDQAPFIMHFDQPVNVEGPSSKWPYQDPNQLKLNLKEMKIRKIVRNVLRESLEKSNVYVGKEHSITRFLRSIDSEISPYIDRISDTEVKINPKAFEIEPALEGEGGMFEFFGLEPKFSINLNESDDVDWDLYDLMDDVKFEMFQKYISDIEKEKPSWEEKRYLKARQPWRVVPFVQLKTVWEAFIDHGKVPDKMVRMLEQIEEVITENILKANINTEMAGHFQNDPKHEWRSYLEGVVPEEELEDRIEYLDSWFGEWITESNGQMRISDYGLEKLNQKLSELRKIGIPEKKLKKIDEILNVIHQRSDIAGWFIEGGSRALSQLSGMEEEMNENKIRSIIRNEFINEAKKKSGKSKFEKLKDNKVPLTDEERDKVMKADAVWHHGPNGEATPAVWKSKDKKTGKVTYVCHTHRAYNTAPTLNGAISRYHKFIKGTA